MRSIELCLSTLRHPQQLPCRNPPSSTDTDVIIASLYLARAPPPLLKRTKPSHMPCASPAFSIGPSGAALVGSHSPSTLAHHVRRPTSPKSPTKTFLLLLLLHQGGGGAGPGMLLGVAVLPLSRQATQTKTPASCWLVHSHFHQLHIHHPMSERQLYGRPLCL